MPDFTYTQGRYLAFIRAYIDLQGCPPAEAEIAAALRVSPPSVHQMVKTLERNGLIQRQPGQARSIQLLVPREQIPLWNQCSAAEAPAPAPPAPRRRARKARAAAEDAPPTARLYVLTFFLSGGPRGEMFANTLISRTIEIRGDQTLAELHHAAFEAFDREDEHMYEFEFWKRRSDPAELVIRGSPVWVTSEDQMDVADTTTLDDLGLKRGRVFGYLFDFGDEWYHHVRVDRIEPALANVAYPRVVQRVGKSPPQYSDD